MKTENKNSRWNVLSTIEYVCKNTKEKQLKFPERTNLDTSVRGIVLSHKVSQSDFTPFLRLVNN